MRDLATSHPYDSWVARLQIHTQTTIAWKIHSKIDKRYAIYRPVLSKETQC